MAMECVCIRIPGGLSNLSQVDGTKTDMLSSLSQKYLKKYPKKCCQIYQF